MFCFVLCIVGLFMLFDVCNFNTYNRGQYTVTDSLKEETHYEWIARHGMAWFITAWLCSDPL